MKEAKKTLETLLKIKPIDEDIQLSDENITYLEINNWNKSMFGTEALNNNISFQTYGIDILIFC